APGRADTRVTGVRLQQGQWHDLGRVVMPRGAVVRGRVTVEGSELPAPQASVTLVAGTVFDDTVLRALPGRENGLVVNADANGFYEFANAPMRGAVQLTAVAPGFAAVLQQNVQLQADKPVEVNFGLRPGHSLGGTLTDADGAPIAGARLEAWPMTAAGQALLGQSHADGTFVVHGLAAGKHRLRVFARGFQNLELEDLTPTRMDLRLVMQPRARLQVTVRGDDGQPLHSYQLAVRRYFPNKDPGAPEVSRGDLGLLADVPEQRVRLDRMTDRAEVLGIPPGDYVCQVRAEGYAKTLSAPFRIEPMMRSATVEVTMTTGATLRGLVLDEAGLPLAGASVSTQAQGATPDNPLWRMLAGAAPEKVTARTAKTAANGTFELPLLALGSYDLVVEHPEACRTLVRNLDLHQPGLRNVPPVRLAAGAIVEGLATLGGKIQGQIRVILTSPAEDSGPTTGPVRLEASTDENGHYTMPRRVPPGNYELRAFAVVSADPASQPILQLMQMQRSATPLVVPPGRRAVVCDLDLPQDR
ncbi:MAG: carboxypeptidase regulatory-like domain-containing protein, partial [Planctomycetes bacterium]|nr:carboxypeptidase regulatory-like domain-containing protein [Planctomycetota bacterium]